jgi:hypothetical protein
MADDVLEQKKGGTFAEDLGVEVEYAEVEDVSAEQFNKYIETAAAELNPSLLPQEELIYEDEEEGTMGLEEYLGFLGNHAEGQSLALSRLDVKTDGMLVKLNRIQEVMDKLLDATTDLLGSLESENPLLCDDEDVFEDMELDDYTPKKKGTPGRPVKEAPKTIIPPKKEKTKKTVVKKKTVAKPVAKKKAPAKKKAAKKKSKR